MLTALEEYSETDEEVDDFSTDVGQSHTLHGIDLQTASSSSGQCMTVQGHNIANTGEWFNLFIITVKVFLKGVKFIKRISHTQIFSVEI